MFKHTPTQLNTHTRHTHDAWVYGGPLTHLLLESNERCVIRLGVSHHTNLIYWGSNMILIITVWRATGQLAWRVHGLLDSQPESSPHVFHAQWHLTNGTGGIIKLEHTHTAWTQSLLLYFVIYIFIWMQYVTKNSNCTKQTLSKLHSNFLELRTKLLTLPLGTTVIYMEGSLLKQNCHTKLFPCSLSGGASLISRIPLCLPVCYLT